MTMFRFNSERIESIAQQFDLSLVALFGSYAKGHALDQSDIDLAVWTEHKPITSEYEMAVWTAFMDLLQTNKVDLVILNRASPLLTFRIAREGKAIYEATGGRFIRFQSYAARKYDDAKKILEWKRVYLDNFLKGKRRYGN